MNNKIMLHWQLLWKPPNMKKMLKRAEQNLYGCSFLLVHQIREESAVFSRMGRHVSGSRLYIFLRKVASGKLLQKKVTNASMSCSVDKVKKFTKVWEKEKEKILFLCTPTFLESVPNSDTCTIFQAKFCDFRSPVSDKSEAQQYPFLHDLSQTNSNVCP